MGRSKAVLAPHERRGYFLLQKHFRDVKMALLARHLGVTREYARQLMTGISGPGVGVAFRIEDESMGRIPARAWTERQKGKP